MFFFSSRIQYTSFSLVTVFFFKQKTAYDMRISDWSSDVCSSDLAARGDVAGDQHVAAAVAETHQHLVAVALLHVAVQRRRGEAQEIGRASCRERVCQ